MISSDKQCKLQLIVFSTVVNCSFKQIQRPDIHYQEASSTVRRVSMETLTRFTFTEKQFLPTVSSSGIAKTLVKLIPLQNATTTTKVQEQHEEITRNLAGTADWLIACNLQHYLRQPKACFLAQNVIYCYSEESL